MNNFKNIKKIKYSFSCNVKVIELLDSLKIELLLDCSIFFEIGEFLLEAFIFLFIIWGINIKDWHKFWKNKYDKIFNESNSVVFIVKKYSAKNRAIFVINEANISNQSFFEHFPKDKQHFFFHLIILFIKFKQRKK